MNKINSSSYQSGKLIVDKIRMMGFNINPLPVPFKITCINCNNTFEMIKMEGMCTSCNMVYGVTPCHSHSSEFAQPAGVKY